MDIKLKLKKESWEYLFEHAEINLSEKSGKTSVEADPYYAIRDYLETQLEMCTSQNVEDIDDAVDPAQISLF